ncbi:MAG TPA: acetolactate synthase small subunit [bacterium]|nr:acetolactate synthase small subunit [bacterium]
MRNNKETGLHLVIITVENKTGVLARIAGLFSARGYNIDSLCVSETEDSTIAKVTMTVKGHERILEQIYKQLNKLIDVIKVQDLTDGDFIDRELLLIKVKTLNPAVRQEIMQLANAFRAKIVDIGKKSLTLEVVGGISKISAIIDLLKSYGVRELVRTGRIALPREFGQQKKQQV